LKKVLLAIPTYNEHGNVNRIYHLIRKYNKKIKILFVDDNSNDGTIFQLRELCRSDNKVSMMVRQKKLGIGSAHKFIFKIAYKMKINYLITMDADLSHNPNLINKMLKLIMYFDLVQTNRFLDKKSLNNWPFYRVLLTKLRYYLLYLMLNIKTDSSGAYRCYNLKNIKLSTLLKAKNNSYSFFWESTYIFTRNKFKIKELSMVQNFRTKGSSKLSISDWLFGLIYLFYIFFKKIFNL
jgi:dolichol-phosphate mannosyltransferase|tara:strand:- start:1483 stop:2193 length:711 start_codon:yes stop_codon:yes gene_type:complete